MSPSINRFASISISLSRFGNLAIIASSVWVYVISHTDALGPRFFGPAFFGGKSIATRYQHGINRPPQESPIVDQPIRHAGYVAGTHRPREIVRRKLTLAEGKLPLVKGTLVLGLGDVTVAERNFTIVEETLAGARRSVPSPR